MKHLCSVSNNHSKNTRFGLFGILTLFALFFCSCDGTSIFASRPDREGYDPILHDQLACRELVKINDVLSFMSKEKLGPTVWLFLDDSHLPTEKFNNRKPQTADSLLIQQIIPKITSYDKNWRYTGWLSASERIIDSPVFTDWCIATQYYLLYTLYDRCEYRKLFPDFKKFEDKFQKKFGILESTIKELKELRTLWLQQAMTVFDNLNDEECDYSELMNDSHKEFQLWQICKRTETIGEENWFGVHTGRRTGGAFIIAYFNENKKRIGLKYVQYDNVLSHDITIDKDEASVTIDDEED